MQRFVERTVRQEKHSMQSWALREYDANGTPDVMPWTMWHFGVNFRCGRLTRVVSYEGQQDHETLRRASVAHHSGDMDESETTPMPLDHSDRLFARMRPRGFTITPFGTAREIKDITLMVHPWPESTDQVRCHVWGGVQYESEVDFRRRVMPDALQVQLWLPQARYDALCVAALRPDTQVSLRLSSANGFYAHWTPSVTTDALKVLTSGNDVPVANPDQLETRPWRLGEVGGVDLTVESAVPTAKKKKRPKKPPTRPEPPAPPPPPPAMPNLKTPLWIAVALLGLLLFK